MPQFLLLLRPARPTFLQDSTEAERAIVGEHFAYMQRATEAGTAILVGRTQDEEPLGLCIFEANDDDAAKRFVEGDPAIANGVFTAELRSFSIALMRTSQGSQ